MTYNDKVIRVKWLNSFSYLNLQIVIQIEDLKVRRVYFLIIYLKFTNRQNYYYLLKLKASIPKNAWIIHFRYPSRLLVFVQTVLPRPNDGAAIWNKDIRGLTIMRPRGTKKFLNYWMNHLHWYAMVPICIKIPLCIVLSLQLQ